MKPIILVLDIETAPFEVYTWHLKDQRITLPQIKNESFIMSWAAKVVGTSPSSLMQQDCRKTIGDDSRILKVLWELMNKSHYILTQNGIKFDIPKILGRFMTHGFSRPRFFKQIDTYKEHKDKDFTSHSLDYMTHKFCNKYTKKDHGKYPGWKLWTECLKGNIKAWDDMKNYNGYDVLSTEELFLNTQDWMSIKLPELVNKITACKCGYKGNMIEGKIRTSKTGQYTQPTCFKCGILQPKEML